MRIATVVIILSFFSSPASGQEQRKFILGAHEKILDVSWKDSLYRFPAFRDGKLTFSGGFTPAYSLKMNYNIYFEKMAYIHPSSDTLFLDIPATVELIAIGDNLIYHDDQKGFLEIIIAGRLTLAMRYRFLLEGIELVRGVGGSGYGEAVRVVGMTNDKRGMTLDHSRVYTKIVGYYFIDSDNNIYRPTKITLRKIARDDGQDISQYLRENDIDFEQSRDLISLVTYYNSLER